MAVKVFLLGRFVEKLYSVTTLEARFQAYEECVRSLGFDGLTFAFMPNSDYTAHMLSPIFLHSDPYPMGFLTHYAEEQLHLNDFTIRKIMNNELTPMDWREHECCQLVSPEEKKVIVIAREDYGIINAISIPTMHRKIGMAGASIISSEKDRCFNILKSENLDTLVRCTQIFHDITFLNNSVPNAFTLSYVKTLKPREIKILRYLADGKPFKNIEDDTGINYRFASNTLDSLRARLGGINKDKLLYLIGLLNILDDF